MKTREVAEDLARSGAVTPLEGMLKAMQERYDAEDHERLVGFVDGVRDSKTSAAC